MVIAGSSIESARTVLPEGSGRLADNVVIFSRALRSAGIKIGPGSVADAIEAVGTIGIGSRDEFYAALRCVLIKRREDQAVFDEAFRLFWSSYDLLEKMIVMPSALERLSADKRKAGKARVSEALVSGQAHKACENDDPLIELDARHTSSGGDVLRRTDFARMTAGESVLAKRALSDLVLPFDEVRTRRFHPSLRQMVIDPRATLRHSMRTGGDLIIPRFRQQTMMHPPLVVLADISGSMSQYTRIFLHFLHVLTKKRRRMHTFLFGTRLTNVTRQMRYRDPEEAMDECTAAVSDWSGGTRIGQTLRAFNRLWSRRVLGQGAVVLLITDGLERDDPQDLEREMDRLHRSCRRLIWLSPLLRFDGFEARARGVRAMLPHVDEFRAIHNLAAISDLAEALSGARSRDADPRRYLSKERR